MARKGCGPYGLGAPKSMAKQTKTDPKSGNTVRSERQVDGGTEVTFTTTEPGSGGVDFEINQKPTKTYKQFKAEGGDVEAAKAYNEAKKAKGRVNPTPDKVTKKTRFIPNPIGGEPLGPIMRPTMDKAPGIKPLAKPYNPDAPSGKYFYKKAVNQKFGGSSDTGRSSSNVTGPNWGDKDYGNETQSRPMTQREENLLATDIARKTGGATASPYGKGGEEGFQNYLSQVENKLKERTQKLQNRSSNKKVTSPAYKMKGYGSKSYK